MESSNYKGYRHDVRERRKRAVLLTTSFAILVSLHHVHKNFQKNNSFIGTTENYTKKDALINSISLNDFHHVTGEIETVESDDGQQPKQQHANIKQIDDNLQPANVPIYLSEISGGAVYAIDYHYLTSIWDRNTTYEHILEQAQQRTPYYNNTTTTNNAQTSLQHALMNNKDNNITIIFHTVPKTASSTMRKSCVEVQHDVCNLPRESNRGTWPDGYRTPKRLTQLFEICPTTFHFCVKGPIPVTRNYTQFYNTRTFLHMFPFRNYNEWTRSALHQIAYRDILDGNTTKGCDETVELLNECLPHKYELDFHKYTKSVLAMWMKSYNHAIRMNGDGVVEQHHTILLYNYLHLDETLNWLSESYGAPQIKGTDRKINSVRPDKSCRDEEEMLNKFHDCFSDDLAGLH